MDGLIAARVGVQGKGVGVMAGLVHGESLEGLAAAAGVLRWPRALVCVAGRLVGQAERRWDADLVALAHCDEGLPVGLWWRSRGGPVGVLCEGLS
jgi:hypothetical protein